MSELYVALYTFNSDEDGDLTFKEGDVITVTRADGDWGTGNCDKRSGIFPANFVKKMESRPPGPAKDAVGDRFDIYWLLYAFVADVAFVYGIGKYF